MSLADREDVDRERQASLGRASGRVRRRKSLERQRIAAHLADLGVSNKAIAARLGISLRQVQRLLRESEDDGE